MTRRARQPGRFFAASLAVALVVGLSGCGARPEPSPRPPENAGRPIRSSSAVTAAAPAIPPPPPPFPCSLTGRTVILDPGHGGKDPGASHFGLNEKDIVLDLAFRTAALLRHLGATVLLTREGDRFLSLAERSAFANRHPEAVMVSIHVNASDRNPLASGIETYILSPALGESGRDGLIAVRHNPTDGSGVRDRESAGGPATAIRKRGSDLAENIQRRLPDRLNQPDRGIRTKDLAVLRDTHSCPVVLVEMGFLSHPATAFAMRTDAWRRRAAEALCEGISDFFGRQAGG